MVPINGFDEIFGARRGPRTATGGAPVKRTPVERTPASCAALTSAPQALRDGLGTLAAAGQTLSAHFFNVGQGDCFLVTGGPWSILFDGGRDPSREVLEELERRIPARDDGERWLDVLCVSHYDADHIQGAAEVVKHLEGRVRHAFIPPFLNPIEAADATTRLLAERLREHPLGEELRMLDLLAGSLASRTEDGDVDAMRLVGELRELLRQHEVDFDEAAARSGAPSARAARAALSALQDAGLGNLGAIVAAVLRVLRLGTAAGVDHETVWAAMLAGSNAVLGAKAAVGKQAIDAAGLNELIRTLRKYKVEYTTPLATDPATWFGNGCQICQLAPLPARVEKLAHRLPVAVMSMLATESASSLYHPSRLSASNQLSSVFALRTYPSWSSGILASADAPFAPMPVGAERVLACCSLVKWAHHGGLSGPFARLMIDAASSMTAHSTNVFVTNGAHVNSHPRACFGDWMRDIAAGSGVDLRVTFANAPHPSLLRCPRWARSEGPLRVSFEQVPAKRKWGARTPEALSCYCW